MVASGAEVPAEVEKVAGDSADRVVEGLGAGAMGIEVTEGVDLVG